MSRHLHRQSTVRLRPIQRYAYYEPETRCYCDGDPCLCPPDVGALKESDFLTVYPGFNVWDVWQVNDLPFSIMMIGIDNNRQLRIWVEDSVRLGAPGATVADSIDLKGGQVEILNGPVSGLKVDRRKEQVSGPAMVVSGPATLRTVRFFNRGSKAVMAWPHDESYLLDKSYVPDSSVPATSGPGPTTIGGTVASGAIEPLKNFLSEIPPVVYIGGVMATIGYLFRKELFQNVKRKLRKR